MQTTIPEELIERLKAYDGAHSLSGPHGFIVWQYSTGENVEILFIRTFEQRKGHGKQLLRSMARNIKPYHSVFVVRRAVNEDAGAFYRACGFKETTISGLYKGEDAVLGVISYDELLRL